MSSKIVTRFAPSPTGKFHVGGIRTALYNYLYARKHGGVFILRCEDTDPVRSKKEFEEYFLELFEWLGLEHDEYYRQSERTEIYKTHLEKLIAEDKAYISKEAPKEVGGRDSVIRFRNPKKKVAFDDLVLGNIEFDTTELGDFVIARSLLSPLYHFTVVVDDFLMNITHVIRGQEHVSNTPRQILIADAVGAPRPIYAHASTILNEERAKLSKRDPLVRPALEYRDEGYLPEALLNFMALIGWNPGDDREIFTLPELSDAFSLERLQKPGAVFNPEKLEWINKEHMKRLNPEQERKKILEYLPDEIKKLPGLETEILPRIAPVLAERITHYGQIRELAGAGEIQYFFSAPEYKAEDLLPRGEEKTDELFSLTQKRLDNIYNMLSNIAPENFTTEKVKETLWDYATEEGRALVLWPMRYALTGREKSTDPFTTAGILGKDETLLRLKRASENLQK